MPVIKSAKKKARQALKHYERNKAIRTQVKTYMKKALTAAKSTPVGNEDLRSLLAEVYSVIDMAAKKRILHKNNADRKKSRVARMLATAGQRQ